MTRTIRLDCSRAARCPRWIFLRITILYGGNGSSETTLLNVMADALRLYRRAEYNRTPFLTIMRACVKPRTMRPIPTGSMILTSDDVFDYMLDLRALNDGVDMRREQMFADYNDLRREKFQMHGMKDYDRLKQVSAARRYSQSQMAPHAANVRTRSNGESALAVFSERIREDALYLLDEPENSLSPERQLELARFCMIRRGFTAANLSWRHTRRFYWPCRGGADLRFGQRLSQQSVGRNWKTYGQRGNFSRATKMNLNKKPPAGVVLNHTCGRWCYFKQQLEIKPCWQSRTARSSRGR
ncbi:MAG: hypothetical protein ACLTYY_03900 [Faecalibacterium prausnitzii]